MQACSNAGGRSTAAVVGGTAARIGGGKFANGAAFGAFAYAVTSAAEEYKFRRMVRVARDALNEYNPLSVAENREYAGLIYETDGGTIASTPGVPGPLCDAAYGCIVDPWDALKFVPDGATVLADWHTHGPINPSFPKGWSEFFGEADVVGINADANSNPGYMGGFLGTPGGRMFFYPAGALQLRDWTPEAIKKIQIPHGRIRK